MEWIVALRILKLKLQITMWWYLEMELWEIIRFSWGHKVRFLLTDLVFLWEEILESLVSLSLCTATEERPCHPGPRNYWQFEGKYQERKNQKENYLYWLSETVCSFAPSCPALCKLMDCSPPGSSVHGTFQARILEWVVISYSRGNPGTKPTSLGSPALGDRFFTTALPQRICIFP